MSKELVISAASHERRVAILEEGQLVEIYIEREKEFALVGSIYKGRVTRVLPGMQSAFVDIGLDGDAFLYVSDVFENLEDYDHGHGHAEPHASAAPPISVTVHTEALPGEIIGHGAEPGDMHGVEQGDEAAQHELSEAESLHESHRENEHREHEHVDHSDHVPDHEEHAAIEEHHDADASTHSDVHAEPEERQPESNAAAPQNFGHHYNPTQKYPPRNDRGGPPRNDRGGQNFGRGDQGGDRGGDRGRGRFGRRGGRRRGGRPPGPGGPTGGRNLPPSKYASPQGDQQRPTESRGGYDQRGQQPRGFEPRGQQPRGFENRRPETGSRPVGPVESSAEDEIILPGESLAKYRNKPVASAAPMAPVVEPELHEPQPELDEPMPRAALDRK